MNIVISSRHQNIIQSETHSVLQINWSVVRVEKMSPIFSNTVLVLIVIQRCFGKCHKKKEANKIFIIVKCREIIK